jgi:hypothetical protein
MKTPNCNWHLFLHKRWYLQQCSQISRKKTPLFLASIPIQGKNVLAEGTWQGSAGHWLFETGYIVQWAPLSYFEEMPWKAQTLCAMKTTSLLIAKLHATCGYGHEPENSTAVARSRQKRLSCSRQTQVRKRAENCKGFFKRWSHLDAFRGHCFGYRRTRNYSPGNQEPYPPSRLKHGSNSWRERRTESRNYSLLSGERL